MTKEYLKTRVEPIKNRQLEESNIQLVPCNNDWLGNKSLLLVVMYY